MVSGFIRGVTLTCALLVFAVFWCNAQGSEFNQHLQRSIKSYHAENLDAAKQSALAARKAAANGDQRQRADKVLQQIETKVQRNQAAERLARRVGIREDELPSGATDDHSGDAEFDEERLDQTLSVFTRDQGGKLVEGILSEFQCRADNPRMVIESEGKPVVVEIDQPGDILVTRAGLRSSNFDFRCGKQKPERVRLGYRPALKDGRVGFLRILQFE